MAKSTKAEQGEHLIAIRPGVLNDAEHALGNLFQRIHHVARVARDGLGPHAERLNGALADLEALLELVFDYVTPVEVELRAVTCGRVAESLVANLQMHVPGGVEVTTVPTLSVMADPRLLSRGFQLISQSRGQVLRAAAAAALSVGRDAASDRVEFVLSADHHSLPSSSEEAGLAWEVAARLIELQGGELRQSVGERLVYMVALPVVE